MNFMISQIFANTSFKKNKQLILSSLFLIYYVVYAISPLSYSINVKKKVDRIGDANGMSASLNNLNIFLLEVICAKIDTKKDFDQSNSTVTVFIRKARAILPENASVKFPTLENLLLFAHITPFFDNSSSRLLVSSDQWNSIWGFNPLHSGPAPPFA